MAFRPRSAKPTKTVEELEAEFIGGAKADLAEGIVTPTPEVAQEPKAAKADKPAPQKTSQSTKEKSETELTLVRQKQESTKGSKKDKPADKESSKQDFHQFVTRSHWPLFETPSPSLADGRSDLDKPMLIRCPEHLWLSVDRHCDAIGISKSKWLRFAIEKLMAEEQELFATRKKKGV